MLQRIKSPIDAGLTRAQVLKLDGVQARSVVDCSDMEPSSLYFDKRDYDLLRIVNDILSRDDYPGHKRLLAPYLHPHGIKEMAAPRALRIAYAVAHLLGSLETGKAEDRLAALRALRDEVLYTSQSSMRINTARVLVEIMKNLVRSQGDCRQQLMLAHDFNISASGRPRVIRAQLRKYHLLEMPEAWNQVAFDDHVHDANTKGRKSATHLIMDAWIKGIRSLTVIYYNYVPRNAARELLEAAATMNIEVRIGIEFFARFRHKYAKLIWVPRGFTDAQGFLEFLSLPAVDGFMEEGRQVSRHHRAYVLAVLHSFNSNHLPALGEHYGIRIAPLDETEFLSFVGTGQASIHHLGKFIHERLLGRFQERVLMLRLQYPGASPEERERLEQAVEEMNSVDVLHILQEYLRPDKNPGLHDPDAPGDPNAPDLLRLSAGDLIDRLGRLHSRFRVTLNLCDLRVEDVLELLWDCGGAITHLEILNLKNHFLGREFDNERIIKLQTALNDGNVIKLKKYINEIVERMGDRDGTERKDKFIEILCDIPKLQSFYRDRPLRTCIGTDSTGQSGRVPGMGLILKDSLPLRVQRELERIRGESCHDVPVAVTAYPQATFVPRNGGGLPGELYALARRVPGLSTLGYERRDDWVLKSYRPAPQEGSNIYTLGGAQRDETNGLTLTPPAGPVYASIPLRYLKTGMKIGLKVLAGFIPAFLTFALTKDWWLLAYGGAVIWFAITGLRNVIQSMLGCGGFHRSAMVRWNSYVSWNRLADSLLYTGFSVPLLDWLVKTVLLDRGFGITTATSPLLLYSVMSLVNGLYLASHNLFRGLPRSAAVGNLFRSVFAIPLALGFNEIADDILLAVGVVDPLLVLQMWAAVIAKLASDTVAGIIEGLADKMTYMRIRSMDYRSKLRQLFDTYAHLEMVFPLEDVLTLLESTKEFMLAVEYEKADMVRIVIVNALDLLYFWMYQPRARDVLMQSLREMSREERKVFLLSQYVLFREREISQLFLDGLVGRNFSRALAFYLDNWQRYLEDIEHQADRHSPSPQRKEAAAAASV